MCGLAGVIGDLTIQHKDIFKDLMRVVSLRGVHSTGVIAIDQKNNYKWAKEVGEPAYLFDTRRYDNAVNGNLSGLIGHCRHKTVGEISRNTAHPFDFPDEGIVGVHNGTLKNYYKLTDKVASKVDSEILYEHLAANDAQTTFSTIEGAWACVWWDNNTNKVHFIRNDERPLWFAWSKDAKALFWASERWMLGAVERKIDLLTTEGLGKFIGLPINTLWSFSVTPNDKDTKVHFLGGEKIDPFVPLPVTTGIHYMGKNTTVTSTKGTKNSGGSVPSPFQETLDDPLPEELQIPVELVGNVKGFIPKEKKTLTTNEVPFLGISVKPKDESTDGLNSLSYAKPKESRRTLTSRLLGLTPSEESSSTLRESQLKRLKSFVSTRLISGVLYITDNKTGKEYSEKEFEKATNALCGFCHSPIGDFEEVHEFVKVDKFICKSCATEPAIPCVISQ